mmetsp:Transcript_4144/g.11746  ORF Transcript_4144/g.11746 Transcript_4144/m.11746 type:complete len:530 (+) Transcript_4144:254-1843(+)
MSQTGDNEVPEVEAEAGAETETETDCPLTGENEVPMPEADCPICLDLMNDCDVRHPLQCSNACGYNFCVSCAESLISSSKDDYGEASDGNMHVKIFLNCPNCRSDLSTSIRDTVLLRKAAHIKQCSGDCDEELSASELRMRNVMDDAKVRSAIAEARRREADFFGIYQEEDDGQESFARKDDNDRTTDNGAAAADTSYDECGVEADLVKGVHESMRWPKQPYNHHLISVKPSREIDLSLLSGLEIAMTSAEQELVVDLMTSGKVSQVANAAQILHGVQLNVFGKSRTTASKDVATERMTERSNAARSSVFALIDEAKHIREKAENVKKQAGNAGLVAQNLAFPPLSTAHARTAASHRATEISIRRNMERLKRFPLPVRMPKFVELELPDHCSIPFGLVNDEWDGYLIDAFTKISVGFGGAVHKKHPKHGGVYRILNMDANDDSVSNPRIDVDRSRVLVASVRSEAGRQGVVKGDVITHINGEEFHGTKADFKQAMRSALERNDGNTLELILNAERSVVEAIKRRAAIMD